MMRCIKQNQTTNPGGSWNSKGKFMLNCWNAWDCVRDESSFRIRYSGPSRRTRDFKKSKYLRPKRTILNHDDPFLWDQVSERFLILRSFRRCRLILQENP